jgi:hypothetical protein
MPKQPLDHLRSRKKAIQFTFSIAEDVQYQDKVSELKTKLAQRELQFRIGSRGQMAPEDSAELEEIKSELETAEEELEPHLLWFRARNLPAPEYDDLVSKHAPTEEQRKKARKDGNVLLYDPETFLPELVSKCIYFLYTVDDDGEVQSAHPPFNDKRPEDAPEVLEELISPEFLKEMKENGAWAVGEIMTLAGSASNVNQGIRRTFELGNG